MYIGGQYLSIRASRAENSLVIRQSWCILGRQDNLKVTLARERENTLRLLWVGGSYPGSEWVEEELLLSLWEQVKDPRPSNLEGDRSSEDWME